MHVPAQWGLKFWRKSVTYPITQEYKTRKYLMHLLVELHTKDTTEIFFRIIWNSHYFKTTQKCCLLRRKQHDVLLVSTTTKFPRVYSLQDLIHILTSNFEYCLNLHIRLMTTDWGEHMTPQKEHWNNHLFNIGLRVIQKRSHTRTSRGFQVRDVIPLHYRGNIITFLRSIIRTLDQNIF